MIARAGRSAWRGLFWCGLNALSVLAFGTAHSVLARPHVRRLVAADESTFRAVYTALSGIHLAFVAATWRPVCASLWELGLPSSVRQYRWAVDALLAAPFFLGIAAASGAAPGGGLAFVGLGAASSRSSQTPSVLWTDGVYGIVRHPMYTCLILAMVFTTHMSANRAAAVVGVLGYLYGFGVYLEEKGLAKTFGRQYREYQKRVPAVIPGPLEGAIASLCPCPKL
ncbi:hypothetical protein FNF29_01045 [Cafeteria roenbergensis]|uniref:Nuclear envelope membrane protein n=1 Tax=Cafeteria roenbergensis TaxID=33653 RepID=A0A5A8CT01_CAFRO|nr:hypothetical protein FNF29_01045 [Cafeteria roenbergensis]KAA0164550.1 hypothetical protein FNF28_03792 [Cafeteria roenbergensis]|eukprot:KAA0156255.1 hypothetical protein FNF29_01045 [Cafeteria roenbergensis]